MERLGDIVARVLAGVRATMDGEMAGEAAGEDAASPLARGTGGETRTRKGDRLSPRATVRRGSGPAGSDKLDWSLER